MCRAVHGSLSLLDTHQERRDESVKFLVEFAESIRRLGVTRLQGSKQKTRGQSDAGNREEDAPRDMCLSLRAAGLLLKKADGISFRPAPFVMHSRRRNKVLGLQCQWHSFHQLLGRSQFIVNRKYLLRPSNLDPMLRLISILPIQHLF
jgi:hypothetical protein